MENKLQHFTFGESNIRVFLNEKNEPEFCAADVCKILGYQNGPKAIVDHCKSTGITKRYTGVRTGTKADGSPSIQQVEYSFITEGNLYRLIAKSQLPEAERFESWIFDEVLPSIRKHGAYMTYDTIERSLQDPDNLIKILTTLKEERKARELAEMRSEIQQAELDKAAPKVQYYEDVLQSESTYTSTSIAKELGMSAKTMHQLLHKRGVMYLHENHWVLYAPYQGKGYTKTRTHNYERIEDGKKIKVTNMITVWTEKGREFIHHLLKSYKAA